MPFLRTLLLASVGAGALLAGPPIAAQQPTTPAAPPAAAAPAAPAAPRPLPSVNGEAVTEADLGAAEAELGEALAQVPEAQRREQLVEFVVTVKLLAQQARAANLHQSPETQARIRFLTERFLMESHLRAEIDKLITPEAIQAFYNERVRSAPAETEVRARHILVNTEEEAKAVIAALGAGQTFEALARERSIDPGSKDEGGDLGFFTRDRMVPEFAQAAFALEPGQVSREPVRSQFGWHVLKVEERRQTTPPTLAEVEPQIRQFLARRGQSEIVQRLRSQARIERAN